MHNVRKITEDLYWVGGDEHRLHLFENVHPIARGVSYNSYLLLDKKTVLFDTVDWAIGRQFIENIKHVLKDRKLDYMVINHMEPDHAAMIQEVVMHYPEVRIISSEKAFYFMNQFGFHIDPEKCETVVEGDTKSFGKHKILFVAAPMVHWPEAMVSFDLTNGVLFSADAFGSFGALDGKLFNDEVNFDRDWINDARRYVQALLKKAGGIDIKMICPLHGPVWRNDFEYLLDKYNRWSKYIPEEKGVMIVYASMYGNTENAASVLARKLVEKGMTNVHISELIAETFRYSHIVFASVTYNLGIYPPMHNYLMDMKALNVQKRTVAVVENGSWACKVGSLMVQALEEMKDMNILNEKVTLTSSMTEDNHIEMDSLVNAILDSMKDK